MNRRLQSTNDLKKLHRLFVRKLIAVAALKMGKSAGDVNMSTDIVQAVGETMIEQSIPETSVS